MKSNKGVTLVALVVTIIVLLILAGVTINMVAGQNGIMTKASTAKTTQLLASVKEATGTAVATLSADETEKSITGGALAAADVKTAIDKEIGNVLKNVNIAYDTDLTATNANVPTTLKITITDKDSNTTLKSANISKIEISIATSDWSITSSVATYTKAIDGKTTVNL